MADAALKTSWETYCLPRLILYWSVPARSQIPLWQCPMLQTAWFLCKSQKAPVDWAQLTLANHCPCSHDKEWTIQCCLCQEWNKWMNHVALSGELHWRIAAQGDVQNLPTVITFFLAASGMYLSPTCVIPFVLNRFSLLLPLASSCAQHQNVRRLQDTTQYC